MAADDILKIVPVLQSGALAKENADFFQQKDKDVGDFLKHGVQNIVGAKLISETANLTGSI